MKLKYVTCGLSVFVVITAVLYFNGCSFIGYSIGKKMDNSKPDFIAIPGWELETIKEGTQIDIILNNGTLVSGEYAGFGFEPTDEYALRFTESQEALSEEVVLPNLGDTIIVTMNDGKEYTVAFAGFGQESVIVQSFVSTARQEVVLSRVENIMDTKGNMIESGIMRKLTFENKIPYRTTILVRKGAKRTSVALDRVNQVQVWLEKNAKKTGFLLGAVIDATILVGVISSYISSEKEPEPPPDTTIGSCPLLYSFNGERYVRESQLFTGAIFEPLKRTDWDYLRHLHEHEGVCRLKVANQLNEIQYVDEIKLLVVEHPPDTYIRPSFSGDLHVLSELQVPETAVDFQGVDVLKLVKADDNEVWISNPFGRDPEDKTQIRDGLVLEFKKPEGATSVKLVFNVQNTLWGGYFTNRVLSFSNREMENWHKLMNSSVDACKAVLDVLVREVALVVQLWNEDAWQIQGFVSPDGALVPNDQAVLLDVHEISDEVLRIKLESTVGIWMVNSVKASYSPDVSVYITELAPVSAEDHLGNDVRELLLNIDNQYYEMPTTQDWAELLFKVPATKDGYARSFVLKSTGYYKTHIVTDAEFQNDLFQQILSEPGAYGQYSLRLLNEYVESALAQMQQE